MLTDKRLSDLEKSCVSMACEIAKLREDIDELRGLSVRETTGSVNYGATYPQQNKKQVRKTGDFVKLPLTGEKVEVLRRFRMNNGWYGDCLHQCGAIDTRFLGGAESA